MREFEAKEYSVSELEKIAAKFLKKHLKVITIPVPIEVIIEKDFKIEIIPAKNLKDSFDTFGLPLKRGDKFEIHIDEDVFDNYPSLYRFTLAEECAHFVLHKNLYDKVNSITEAAEIHVSLRNYEFCDRNAKRMAAAILMPCENLNEDAKILYSKLVRIIGFSEPDVVKKYMVKQLSEKYKVNPTPMRHRLNEYPMKIFTRVDNAMKKRRYKLI